MELEGDGVADLLAGGDGEVWVMLGPAMFRLSCALIWDWLMVVSWFREIIPLGLFMLMMDFITMAGLVGYWRRWPGPRFCEEKEKSTCLENNHHMMFHWPLLSVSWNSFLQLLYSKWNLIALCTKHKKLHLFTREEIGSLWIVMWQIACHNVLGFKCLYGHDKLSWHPRSLLYKPVIDGSTAQLIHFKNSIVWKSVTEPLTARSLEGEQWTHFPLLWYITSNATITDCLGHMREHVSSFWGSHKPICSTEMLL